MPSPNGCISRIHPPLHVCWPKYYATLSSRSSWGVNPSFITYSLPFQLSLGHPATCIAYMYAHIPVKVHTTIYRMHVYIVPKGKYMSLGQKIHGLKRWNKQYHWLGKPTDSKLHTVCTSAQTTNIYNSLYNLTSFRKDKTFRINSFFESKSANDTTLWS